MPAAGGGGGAGGELCVLLQGGDVLALSGEARYCWSHGIDGVTHEAMMSHETPAAELEALGGVGGVGGRSAGGVVVVRGVRVSITLRRMVLDEQGSLLLQQPA